MILLVFSFTMLLLFDFNVLERKELSIEGIKDLFFRDVNVHWNSFLGIGIKLYGDDRVEMKAQF